LSASNASSPKSYRDCPVTEPNGEPLSLNSLDLELLHNYSTSTSYTLSADPILKNLWRINVPHIGFAYEFVMRGILALSALHMAYQNPAKRDIYISQAVLQHQTALRTAISLLAEITEENCSALWIFSALTSFFAMASPRTPGDFLLVGESGIAEWLFVFQGVRSITESSQQMLERGPLAPMFKARGQMVQYLKPDFKREDHLADLRHHINVAPIDSDHLQIYIAAIDELEKSYTVVFNYSSPKDVSFEILLTWLYHFPPEYLLLLKDHTQEALVIFAYGCTLLNRLNFCWWMEGWAVHLIERLYRSLDQEHRLWIQWPVEEIGWIPGEEVRAG
jgi:hypothetical protein